MATPQQEANGLLLVWQSQRAAGIKPEDRRLPSPADQAFERDLDVIRACMERTR